MEDILLSLFNTIVSQLSYFFVDKVEVDQGGYQYLMMLSWVMCACLGNMSLVSRDHVKDLVTRRLMLGMFLRNKPN